ncbi:signal recognition particle-docking protein FtsY [Halomarina oriensis]|uniref:Signal recognition particle receptor FtsY n=1 Tax=Halomarina oriensis TaxID=671145 RepID=A0A6B0GRR6_9EURY|nr:signal recognition particle-docking protein FtsY [Halomarina oriensis]MWG34368.1 signal recognition particle-docking protein FtsY [Halomarina oriensis]
MFDGLKEKLGRFREDAEEAAEEAAEEEAQAADGAADAPAETDPSPEPDAAEAGSESVDDAPTDERAVADDPVTDTGSADGGATGDSADADSTDQSVSSSESGPTRPDGPAQSSEDDRENFKAGFGQRAKAFATGGVIIRPEHLDEPLEQLELALLSSDVEMSVTRQILETIREEVEGTTRAQVQSTGQVVESALREALVDVISVGQFDFEQRVRDADKPMVVIFTGVNGVGKTTSIAKLSEWFESRGLSSVLANGDTYRAGANEQLREHAETLDRKIITHQQGGDPAAVIYDAVEYAEAHDVDVVLGDTAGRLHTSNDLMDQLEKIDRVVDPDMTLFVDEAVAGQDATQRARQFNEAAAIDGAILTKADADSKGGAAISIAHVTGKPILFLGTGQGYEDLERFDPERIVDRLLGE